MFAVATDTERGAKRAQDNTDYGAVSCIDKFIELCGWVEDSES